MALAAFDTLEFVETLKEASVPEAQAKAFATAVRKAYASSDVATKQDIADLRRDTKQDIADLRKDLSAVEERVDTKLEKLGSDLRHEMGELRHEIGDLRKDMDAKHESLRKDMFHEMRELESRLVIRLGRIVGGGLAVLGVIFSLVAKFVH